MSRYTIGRIKTENEFLYGQFFFAETVADSFPLHGKRLPKIRLIL